MQTFLRIGQSNWTLKYYEEGLVRSRRCITVSLSEAILSVNVGRYYCLTLR